MDLDFINFLHPDLWIKIITLIVIGFYVIFTFVVFTQVRTMGKILSLHFAAILKLISIAHVVLAVSLFIFSIVIL